MSASVRATRVAGLLVALLIADPLVIRAEDAGSTALQAMYGKCVESCVREGWEEDLCRRNCDCHAEVIHRGLTDEEVERMLVIAIAEGKGYERIRVWLRETALECRRKVIGKTGKNGRKPAGKPDE